jgi:hypothetical protein
LEGRRKAEAKTKVLPRADVYAEEVGKAVDWTTEPQLDVQWKIVARGVPQGVAMVSLKTVGALEAVPSDAKYDARRQWKVSAANQEPVKFTLSCPELLKAAQKEAKDPFPPKPSVKDAKAVLQGLYRGKKFEPETKLNLYLGADTIVYDLPRSKFASIAVQADQDVQLGSLAIILDCSGSMTAQKNNQGPRRFDKARAALETVLRTIPAGTKLSFWAFAHRIRGNDKEYEFIEHILPLTLLKDNNKTEIIERLMGKINKLEPWGSTPLLKTMIQASKDLEEEKVGFKTLMVLTDGDDTSFLPGVKDLNKIKAKFHPAIKDQFQGKGIGINMIIFESSDDEIERAEAQFKEPLEKLRPAGSFEVVKDEKILVGELQRAWRPQLKIYKANGGVQEMPKEFVVSLPSEKTPNWSRPLNIRELGAYFNLDVQGEIQNLKLDPGDCMEILLKQEKADRRIYYFERRLISNLPGFEEKPRKRYNDWQLAVLQNKQKAPGGQRYGLEMLVTLEDWRNVKQGAKDLLTQHRPGFVWFELKAPGENPPGLRVVNEWNRQGPAWKLQMGEWPKDNNKRPLMPQLDAWWIDTGKQPKAFDAAQFEEVHGHNGVTIGKGNNVVTIERVVFEDRFVRIDGLVRMEKCLVVRLHYNFEGPVMVRMDDKLVYQGEEHHFYNQARKVTAVFYPVTEASVNLTKYTLNLVNLGDFKSHDTTLRVSSKELLLSPPDLADGPAPVPLPLEGQ